ETVDIRPLPPREGRDAMSALQLYVRERRVVLSDFMPILDYAGLRVIEVDTFSLAGEGLAPHMIYSFKVQNNTGEQIPAERAPLLAEALLAARAGETPSDHFAALVLRSGLRWREVDIIRSYANYAFQIGAIPSRVSAARGLAAYPELAALLVELFRVRFEPAAEEGGRRTGELRGQILRGLERVESLTDDRAFRKLVELIEATVRTNYFRHGGADPTARSGGVPYLSFKIRDADVEELKKGGLLYEIYVASSRMEGIHLRGTPVSRGGIRWSDRPDDYRVEVLGLVQTQMVKNATIVPGGSKGGFVTLRRFPDRERMGEEAAEQYRTLIRGMLDLTDNLVEGEVVPPPDVVRHDGDDPYLVVAADKGTAHLSDTANAVAAEYDFWLGDAFASGGSHGYDHKEEGITARGAWECVKRHFRELNKDIQSEPFTVAGIGDMSGDVFGNGMLLSRQIRLIAAFDHRHVFIDPDPDPAVSFAERERLFALRRSSWDDYDRAALSPGAMIVPRASKPTEVTPEARAALGLGDDVGELDGEELVRAVLRAPVELLWNGGIGTYVKHAEETHADVGDTSNDPVRVDAEELRCKVVGEGGNQGFTQRARISFALAGGRINTDALDNSGGVDMSDREVNLKILLGAVVSDGELAMPERNRLLEAMTDEVSELVLDDNAGQSLAVSLDQLRSRERLDDFATLIRTLERAKRFDADDEELPSADTLLERIERGMGMTRPALCVLLAHAKLHAKEEILASTLPDDPAAERCLADYFPPSAVETAGEARLCEHRLHREIVTTMLVNELVNLMGAAFLHRVSRETGHPIPEVAHAWMIASAISGTPEIRADLEPLAGDHPVAVVYRWLLGLGRVLEGTTRWALANVPRAAGTEQTIAALRDGLATLRGGFAGVVAGRDRAIYLERLAELDELELQENLCERMVTLRFLPQLLEILALVPASGADALATARAYYQVADRLELAALRQALMGQPRDDPWERRHAVELADDLGRAQRAITRAVLETSADSPAAAMDRWEREHAGGAEAYRALVSELGDDAPLAAYAVAVRQLEKLARVDAAVAA
ncbi:MAG: NAD-glutamate dehydrogenase domain-containing protein, partial [Longimicrobiaceae bacterium]